MLCRSPRSCLARVDVKRGLDRLIDIGVDEIVMSNKAPSADEENRTRVVAAAKR